MRGLIHVERMKRLQSFALLTVAVIALTTQASAQRGPSLSLDPAASVTLTGWTRSVRWSDPNVQIEVSATDRQGVARLWTVLAASPASLLSRGLCREALKAGVHVTISGYETRDKPCRRAGAAACSAVGSYIVFDGGQTVDLGFRPEGAPLVGVRGSSQLPSCPAPTPRR
jgi:hypothetical protein